jgi:hypothetical protein
MKSKEYQALFHSKEILLNQILLTDLENNLKAENVMLFSMMVHLMSELTGTRMLSLRVNLC